MDIYMPLLYSTTLQKLFIILIAFLWVFLVNSLRFSIYKIMSPKLEMVFFFPILIPLIFHAKLPKPETPGKC